MSQSVMFVVQERINHAWVTLAHIACSDRAQAHLQELRAVAPEPPGGGRYRVIKRRNRINL